MSITITITDPTRDEALRLADYLYELAGYGKTAGIVSHRFEPNATRQSEILKQHIEDLAAGGDEDDERKPEFVQSVSGAPVSENGVEYAASGEPAVLHHVPLNSIAVQVDSAGYPWDERIHSSSQAINADGTWRLKRGVDLVLVTQVREELRGAAPEAPVAGDHGSPELNADAVKLESIFGQGAAGATIADITPVIPALVAPSAPVVPVPPVSPAPAPTGSITFPQLMQRVTAMCAAKIMTIERVLDAAKAEGVDSIPLLATTHADKVGAVAARLGVTL